MVVITTEQQRNIARKNAEINKRNIEVLKRQEQQLNSPRSLRQINTLMKRLHKNKNVKEVLNRIENNRNQEKEMNRISKLQTIKEYRIAEQKRINEWVKNRKAEIQRNRDKAERYIAKGWVGEQVGGEVGDMMKRLRKFVPFDYNFAKPQTTPFTIFKSTPTETKKITLPKSFVSQPNVFNQFKLNNTRNNTNSSMFFKF